MKTLKLNRENAKNAKNAMLLRMCVLTLACVLAVGLFAGCGKGSAEQATGDPAGQVTKRPAESATPAPAPAETFTFKKGSAEVIIGAEASAILTALGDPDGDPYESESCALEGLEITYSYPGFDLYTYKASKNAPEYITGATFWDDTMETAEGLYIGAPRSKVESLYGVSTGDKTNITVEKGKCAILIVMENDAVKSIVYNYPAENIVGG